MAAFFRARCSAFAPGELVSHEVRHLAERLHVAGEAHDLEKGHGSQLRACIVGIAFAHQRGIGLMYPLGYLAGRVAALKNRFLKYREQSVFHISSP